jgi:Holliday junction DNA helicase RuvA
MLSAATGTVTIIDTHLIDFTVGAITLAVSVANSSMLEAQKTYTLDLYMHWNQENGPTLFGFVSKVEKTIFTLILSCAGIGPKIALSILNQLGADAFIEAVQTGNSAMLSNVQGIGAKKAELLIFNIKSKVIKLLESGTLVPKTSTSSLWYTVHQALESLNYSQVEIQHALEQAKTQLGDKNPTFDQLIRIALSALSKKR